MLGLKSSERFESLLSEARKVMAERNSIQAAIRENKAALAREEEALATARRRVDEEEFASAQQPGNLAVASQAAQEAVIKSELRVKSVRLRLRGLQEKLTAQEGKLSSLKDDLTQFVTAFLSEKLSELSGQFDVALAQLRELHCKAYALYTACGGKRAESLGYKPHLKLMGMVAENPVTNYGAAIIQGIFRSAEGKKQMIRDHWREDPGAEELHSAVTSMEGAIAEVFGETPAREDQAV